MFRTVIGKPEDPESLRCVMNITGEELGCLIDILQEKYITIETFIGATDSEQKDSVKNSLKNFFPDIVQLPDSEIDRALQLYKDKCATQYRIIYDYLQAINLPFYADE